MGDYVVIVFSGRDKNVCACVTLECTAELGGGKEEETREFGAQVL